MTSRRRTASETGISTTATLHARKRSFSESWRRGTGRRLARSRRKPNCRGCRGRRRCQGDRGDFTLITSTSSTTVACLLTRLPDLGERHHSPVQRGDPVDSQAEALDVLDEVLREGERWWGRRVRRGRIVGVGLYEDPLGGKV